MSPLVIGLGLILFAFLASDEQAPATVADPAPKRARGRPKGSKSTKGATKAPKRSHKKKTVAGGSRSAGSTPPSDEGATVSPPSDAEGGTDDDATS